MTDRQAKDTTLKRLKPLVEFIQSCHTPETRRQYMEETERGLGWALEYEGDGEDRYDNTVVGSLAEAGRDQVWRILAALLYGLEDLQPGRFIRAQGRRRDLVSAGDFYNALDEACDALNKLKTLNDRIAKIQSEEYEANTPAYGRHARQRLSVADMTYHRAELEEELDGRLLDGDYVE